MRTPVLVSSKRITTINNLRVTLIVNNLHLKRSQLNAQQTVLIINALRRINTNIGANTQSSICTMKKINF